MVWAAPHLHRKFQQLKEIYPFKLKVGGIVVRAYADLGVEEFLVMPDERLLSLCTGKLVTFQEGDEAHFYRILNCDDMVEEIAKRNCMIAELKHEEGRFWTVFANLGDMNELRCSAPELQEVLLDLLILVCRMK